LKGLIRECDWKDFCDDTDARKPLIVEKSLIESEACPRTGSNMEDVEIEEVERSRGDKCDDCPYCSERGSRAQLHFRYIIPSKNTQQVINSIFSQCKYTLFLFILKAVDFCLICVVKNDDDEPIAEKVEEISVDIECETKETSRRCDNDEKQVIDEDETTCPEI